MIFCSIILVNYNGEDVIMDCLNSIKKFLPKDHCETILVDNNSQDNSVEIIENSFPEIQLIKLSKNIGFGAGNNVAVKVSKGEFLFFLNTDTILTENILPHLIELMSTDLSIGIIAPKLLFPDGSFQISFAPEIGIRGEYQSKKVHKDSQNKERLHTIEQNFQDLREVDVVVGAAFLIHRKLFNSLGGFDENFFMYFEESDLCQRVRNRGYKVLYTPYVSLIHVRGHSVKKTVNMMALEYRKSQLYYYHKHLPAWELFVLKVYLVCKFMYEYLKTFDSHNLKIIKLAFTYR